MLNMWHHCIAIALAVKTMVLSFSMNKVSRLNHVHRAGDAIALTPLPCPEKFNKSRTVSLLFFAFGQKSDIDGGR